MKPPIFTLCVGNAWGEAALLLAAGATGNRSALPSSTIMIKQVLSCPLISNPATKYLLEYLFSLLQIWTIEAFLRTSWNGLCFLILTNALSSLMCSQLQGFKDKQLMWTLQGKK